jgi:hypothetical protein
MRKKIFHARLHARASSHEIPLTSPRKIRTSTASWSYREAAEIEPFLQILQSKQDQPEGECDADKYRQNDAGGTKDVEGRL